MESWPTAGWETAKEIVITLEYASSSESQAVTESVLRLWLDTLDGLGEYVQIHPSKYDGHGSQTRCEFKDECGDALIALYVLITATKKTTSVQSVGFFAPTQTERRYFTIR